MTSSIMASGADFEETYLLLLFDETASPSSGVARFTTHEIDLHVLQQIRLSLRLRKYCVASSSTALQQNLYWLPVLMAFAKRLRHCQVTYVPCMQRFPCKIIQSKLVSTQLNCSKTGLKVGDKPRYFTFLLVLEHNVAKQLAHFCCPLIIIIIIIIIIVIYLVKALFTIHFY